MYHLLRADEFDAHGALALGFVQGAVPAGDQIDRALGQRGASGVPGAVSQRGDRNVG